MHSLVDDADTSESLSHDSYAGISTHIFGSTTSHLCSHLVLLGSLSRSFAIGPVARDD